MDPKVYGKLLITHGEGDDDDDEGLRDGSPSRNRLPGGNSTGTEATAVELGFSLCVWSFWGTLVYIGRRRAPGAVWASLEAGGAPWEGGRAPHPRGLALRPLTWS